MTSVFDISVIGLIMFLYFTLKLLPGTVYNVVMFLILLAYLKQQPHSQWTLPGLLSVT